jgi:hypothetical protein
MTEDEVIARVREMAADPRCATSAGGWPGGHAAIAESYGPAPDSVVEDAIRRFGFPIPTLLSRLWREVANGGIGPGYGLYGLEGGMTDDALDLPLPELFLEWRDSEEWIELVGAESAPRVFPICDWGCCSFSAVDCSTPEGNLLLFADGVERIDQGVTFAQWIEDWANGIEVGDRNYGRVKKRAQWLP